MLGIYYLAINILFNKTLEITVVKQIWVIMGYDS